MTFSHDALIQCIKREIGMRERVYPGWVTAGKMKAHIAADEIAKMQQVVVELERQRGVDQLLRAAKPFIKAADKMHEVYAALANVGLENIGAWNAAVSHATFITSAHEWAGLRKAALDLEAERATGGGRAADQEAEPEAGAKADGDHAAVAAHEENSRHTRKRASKATK